MRAVLQRVRRASVTVASEVIGQIEQGLLILLGVHRTDTPEQASKLADKIAGLRILEDTDGKMNISVQDVGGSILVVSQFTLYGNCEKGRRPSFVEAEPRPKSPSRSTGSSRTICAGSASPSRPENSGPICRWRWSTTGL